jgi:hypothetical protein
MLPCAVAPLLGALGGLVSEVSTRNLRLDGFTMPAMCRPAAEHDAQIAAGEPSRLLGRHPGTMWSRSAATTSCRTSRGTEDRG